MAFITKSNFKKILYDVEISNLTGEVYKQNILFLSKKDKNFLLSAQQLMKDGSEGVLTIFKKIEKKLDTGSFVFEDGNSSYHISHDCENLHSNYINYKIPDEITKKNIEESYQIVFNTLNNFKVNK